MKCPNSFCLEIRLVCDGEKHCENGEDELNCGKLIEDITLVLGFIEFIKRVGGKI